MPTSEVNAALAEPKKRLDAFNCIFKKDTSVGNALCIEALVRVDMLTLLDECRNLNSYTSVGAVKSKNFRNPCPAVSANIRRFLGMKILIIKFKSK